MRLFLQKYKEQISESHRLQQQQLQPARQPEEGSAPLSPRGSAALRKSSSYLTPIQHYNQICCEV